jgi:hypothetical protein
VGPILLLWMSGSLGWAAAPRMGEMVRDGRYRLAVSAATAALERSPDDADSMAILGAAWTKAGHFGDAVGAFELAAGSPWYDDFGLESHGATRWLRWMQQTWPARWPPVPLPFTR